MLRSGCCYKAQILLAWILVTLVCFFLSIPSAFSHIEKAPSLLIVSFDGFRWNYLNRTATPNFDNVIKHGVHAKKGLKNVFTTSTLTNHWSIVTGLYAESHGIVENEMYDPTINKYYIPLYKNKHPHNDPRFYDTGVEPIWVTNQLQKEDGRSGSIMWWGAENAIKGSRPTYHMPFDLNVDYKYRIDTMVYWFTNSFPINLGLLYFSEPDHTAHACGPDSENVTKLISFADELTGYLFDKLEENNLIDKINVIITSDHGFAATSRDRLIHLDDFVDRSLYDVVHYSPVLSIIPHDKEKEEQIFQKLKSVAETNHFKVYRKADFPERFHYKNHARVTSIIAIADITYSFISNMSDVNFKLAGNHGYDNEEEDMHPFFMAMGPSLKENFQVETFESVDLYPLMCTLLHLHPAANNGSMDVVSLLLRHSHETTDWTFRTYIFCAIIIAAVGGVFIVAACRLHCYLKIKQFNSGKHLNLPSNNAQVPLLSNEDAAENEEF